MAGPAKSIMLFERAIAAYRQGHFDEAETLCRKILKVDREHSAALRMLGVVGLRKRQPGAALEAFDRLLKLQPDSADVLNNRSMALSDLGRNEEALASLDRALALNPSYREALNNRAGLLYALRRFREAADTYAHVMTVSP